MVETFFKTLKSERIWRTAFQTRAEASQAEAAGLRVEPGRFARNAL